MYSDSEVSCCFERGGKMSSSMDNTPIFKSEENNTSCEVMFNETLSLMATLYKNKTKGTFQEKPSCLVVRVKKKTVLRGQIYKGKLGFALFCFALLVYICEIYY